MHTIRHYHLTIYIIYAETEREKIKQHQAGGIVLAKERGVHMGRPKYVLPDNFNEVASSYLRRKIKCNKAIKLLNMARGTFLKYVHLKD